MSVQFNIPNPGQKVNLRTLAKGFGLPLVQRAILAPVFLEPKDEADTSLFGTPLYDTLFITRPEYTTFDFNPETNKYVETPNVLGSNVDYGGELGQGIFIDGAIIEVSHNNNIVETEVINYTGPINEYVGGAGYQITIKGFIATRHPDLYPSSAVRVLNSYANAPVALKVTSSFLNDIFGISEIIVKSTSMSQQQGLRNVQFFQWNCVSDYGFVILQKTNV